MHDKTIGEALAVKLGKLGATPDEIAAALTELKCTGRVGHSTLCPIANYLRKHLGWDDASVGPDNAIVFDEDIDVARATFPEAVRRFVARFDDGEYPTLVEVLSS